MDTPLGFMDLPFRKMEASGIAFTPTDARTKSDLFARFPGAMQAGLGILLSFWWMDGKTFAINQKIKTSCV